MSQIPVYVVRRPDKLGGKKIVSAWVDIYDAKFEALRWAQDYKEDWDYVPATLVLEEGKDEDIPAQVA